jgi:hypothetical protein
MSPRSRILGLLLLLLIATTARTVNAASTKTSDGKETVGKETVGNEAACGETVTVGGKTMGGTGWLGNLVRDQLRMHRDSIITVLEHILATRQKDVVIRTEDIVDTIIQNIWQLRLATLAAPQIRDYMIILLDVPAQNLMAHLNTIIDRPNP